MDSKTTFSLLRKRSSSAHNNPHECSVQATVNPSRGRLRTDARPVTHVRPRDAHLSTAVQITGVPDLIIIACKQRSAVAHTRYSNSHELTNTAVLHSGHRALAGTSTHGRTAVRREARPHLSSCRCVTPRDMPVSMPTRVLALLLSLTHSPRSFYALTRPTPRCARSACHRPLPRCACCRRTCKASKALTLPLMMTLRICCPR